VFKHILVPTDGFNLSQAAVSHAVVFAKEIGACITAFSAQSESPVGYYGEDVAIDSMMKARCAEMAEQHARESLDYVETLCKDAGVSCTRLTLISSLPYEAIIEAATKSGCDLIFMASHGRRGFSGLLLGSETSKVLTHSKIPVLVYR
jgi:nucleotide-binding universal stress UspA family protein